MAVDRLRSDPIVILDANALFIPFQFKLNLDSELSRLLGSYELVIPSCVLWELKGLRSTEKHGSSALTLANKIAQPKWYINFESELLKQHNQVLTTSDARKTDSIILRVAKTLSAIVLTNDKPLLKLLHDNEIQTISLRAKKYLKLNEAY